MRWDLMLKLRRSAASTHPDRPRNQLYRLADPAGRYLYYNDAHTKSFIHVNPVMNQYMVVCEVVAPPVRVYHLHHGLVWVRESRAGAMSRAGNRVLFASFAEVIDAFAEMAATSLPLPEGAL